MRYPLLFLPFVILASIPTTTAQSGILDETFGMNGVVLPQPGPGATLFGNVELQPDGKIITAGSITETESGRTDIFVQRLLPDGTLDATFGGAGTGMISLGSEEWDERGAAVTLRPDGTILIAANATDPIGGERDVQVIRLLADGTTDPDFGTDGTVLLDDLTGFGSDEIVRDMVMLSNGTVVLACEIFDPPESMVVALQADGTPDVGFGSLGSAVVTYGDAYVQFLDMAVRSDDRLVIGGMADLQDAQAQPALYQLMPDGTMDPGFGEQGVVYSPLGLGGLFTSVAALATGQLLAVGRLNSTAMVARYSASGELDATFGTLGVTTVAFDGSADPKVLPRPDGRILMTTGQNESNVGLVRFLENGAVDVSFAGDGAAILDNAATGNETPGSAILQPDGKVLLCASKEPIEGGTSIGRIYRFLNDINVSMVEPSIISHSLRAYPNPARSTTCLTFNVGRSGPVFVEVLDLLGQIVIPNSRSGTWGSGTQMVNLDLEDLVPGNYSVRIMGPEGLHTIQVIKE